MKYHRLFISISLASSLALSSCASKFTPAQREALSTVTVANGKVDSEGYEDPYGGDLAARNATATGAGAGGGALGALIGAAVGSSIAGTQNNMFAGANKNYFPAVRKNTPADLGSMVSNSLKSALKRDAFFSSRVKESSGNIITSEVSSHRLIRIGKNDNGELIFSPEVYVQIHLKDSVGKELCGGQYIGVGTGTYTVAEYASNSVKSRQAYTTAVDKAVQAFITQLAGKTKL
jgi:hypothetical protein